MADPMICRQDGVDVIEREDGECRSEAIRIVVGPEGRLLYVCGTDYSGEDRTFGLVCEADWQMADRICAAFGEG